MGFYFALTGIASPVVETKGQVIHIASPLIRNRPGVSDGAHVSTEIKPVTNYLISRATLKIEPPPLKFTGGRLYFRVALAGDKILDGAHMGAQEALLLMEEIFRHPTYPHS